MASGVKVSEEVVTLYKQLKLRKTNHRVVVMHIDEGEGLIKIDYTQDKDSNKSQEEEYNDFLQRIPTNIGRYIIIDLACIQKNGSTKDTMFLVSWNPDNASMKSNILYTMSKKALVEKISEGMTEIQANDLSDLNYAEILDKGRK